MKDKSILDRVKNLPEHLRSLYLCQLEEIDEANKLCAKCFKLPDVEMLCDGNRRYLADDEMVEQYEFPIIYTGVCRKLELRREERNAEQQEVRRARIANLPASRELQFKDRFEVVFQEGLGFLVYDRLKDKKAYLRRTMLSICAPTGFLMDIVQIVLSSGLVSRYQSVPDYLHDPLSWKELETLLGIDVDLLILDNWDRGAAPEWAVDSLVAMLDFRSACNRSTLINIRSESPHYRSDSEEGLIEALKKSAVFSMEVF